MHTHESQQQPNQGGQDSAAPLELLHSDGQGEVVGHKAVGGDYVRRRLSQPPGQGGARDVQLREQVLVTGLPDELAETVVVDALARRGGEHGGA